MRQFINVSDSDDGNEHKGANESNEAFNGFYNEWFFIVIIKKHKNKNEYKNVFDRNIFPDFKPPK